MLKVIIDTNIFLSGLLFRGNPEKILRAWSQHQFLLYISPELQSEVVNKLKIKFNASEEFIDILLNSLNKYSIQLIPESKIKLLRDPKDDFLLELAEESNADYIITGDKDLLGIKNYKFTKIVSAREFLNIINFRE